MVTSKRLVLALGTLALASAPFVGAQASHWLQARLLSRLQDQAPSLASLWLSYAFGDPSYNPTAEHGAVDCDRNQPAPGEVTILTGNFGGTTVRSCRVRPLTPIFMPVVNCIFIDGMTGVPCTTDDDCDFIPGTCQDSGFCRTALSADDKASFCDQNADYHCGLRVSVDGDQVYPAAGETPLLRTLSEPTEISTEALLGDGGVEPEAIAGGQWALIPGLSPGAHTVQVQGGAFGADGSCGGAGGFALDVTYELDVSRRRGPR